MAPALSRARDPAHAAVGARRVFHFRLARCDRACERVGALDESRKIALSAWGCATVTLTGHRTWPRSARRGAAHHCRCGAVALSRGTAGPLRPPLAPAFACRQACQRRGSDYRNAKRKQRRPGTHRSSLGTATHPSRHAPVGHRHRRLGGPARLARDGVPPASGEHHGRAARLSLTRRVFRKQQDT
jgi:hypothetical protein